MCQCLACNIRLACLHRSAVDRMTGGGAEEGRGGVQSAIAWGLAPGYLLRNILKFIPNQNISNYLKDGADN